MLGKYFVIAVIQCLTHAGLEHMLGYQKYQSVAVKKGTMKRKMLIIGFNTHTKIF